MRTGPFAFVLAAVLAGCASPQFATYEPLPPLPDTQVAALPPMRSFPASAPLASRRANADIAQDFVDLTMQLENGAELPIFTRFEQPISVALVGAVTPVFEAELDRLLIRLRREAGLDIARGADPQAAAITVEAISRNDLARVVPTAACFVLPQRVSWDAFRRNTRRRDLNWTSLERREAATIFVPADISPQEIRDCLHEEIAQALGPVNDLFRLDDSIFNDDNMHSVLTGFDMVILRAAYDPALSTGMTRVQVEAALPGVLDRVNPAGRTPAVRGTSPTPDAWKAAIDTALTPSRSIAVRRRAALDALDIAQREGWQDTRLGLSLLTVGRLAAGDDGRLTIEVFLKARDVYGARPATAVHAANVGLQIAAFALAAGDADTALRLADRHIPAARAAQNAALLSDLLLVKAAALDLLDQPDAAAGVRGEGFGWARYGLRSDASVLRRAAEIAALARQPAEGT